MSTVYDANGNDVKHVPLLKSETCLVMILDAQLHPGKELRA